MSKHESISTLEAATIQDIGAELKRRGGKFLIVAVPRESDGMYGFALTMQYSALSDADWLADQLFSTVLIKIAKARAALEEEEDGNAAR